MKKTLLFLTLLFSLVTTQAQTLDVNATASNPLCNGSCDGQITAEATGGSGGYEYSLKDFSGTVLATFQSADTFNGLCAGNYEVVARDSNLDEASFFIDLLEPAAINFQVQITQMPTSGNSDGEIMVNNVTGGTPFYTFSIDNMTFQASNVFSGLSEGEYTVTVMDSNGCPEFQNITLSSTLSTEDVSSKQIKVFPNPTSKELVLTNVVLGKNYTIVNVLGKVSKKGTITTNSITIEGLSKGIYLLKIEGFKAKKFVKN